MSWADTFRLFISCNRKPMTFGHFVAEPYPGHFGIRVGICVVGGFCIVAAVLLVSTRAEFLVVIWRGTYGSFAQNSEGRVLSLV